METIFSKKGYYMHKNNRRLKPPAIWKTFYVALFVKQLSALKFTLSTFYSRNAFFFR